MYIVTEIQTNADNTVGILNTKHDTRTEAESKYYSVLAAAAMSEVPVHAAVLMTNEGFHIMSQAYMHNASAPEPEEAETEPEEGQEQINE